MIMLVKLRTFRLNDYISKFKMQRIRKVGDSYEILITPDSVSSPTNEILLGDWLYSASSDVLERYHVKTVKTLNEAMNIAYQYPPIAWDKMVSDSVPGFQAISKIIGDSLKYHNTIATFNRILQTPDQLKNTMFNKVNRLGKDFSMFYDVDTVFAFDIIQPWKINLKQTKDQLVAIPELNIIKSVDSPTHMTLIGHAPNGVSYTIRLWPTVYYHCAYWAYSNNIPIGRTVEKFKEIVKVQSSIDSYPIV